MEEEPSEGDEVPQRTLTEGSPEWWADLQKEKWPLLDPKEYAITELLGEGASGAVCAARDLATGDTVAVKKVPDAFGWAAEAKRMLREVCILTRLHHPNVVKIRDIVMPPKKLDEFKDLYIVMELVKSDLGKVLDKGLELSEGLTRTIMVQLVAALQYLHCANILHRDLKPENVLINEVPSVSEPGTTTYNVKLCDFGLARGLMKYEDEEEPAQAAVQEAGAASPPKAPEPAPLTLKRSMSTHVVTRWYRAPELMLRTLRYTDKIGPNPNS